MKVWSYVMLSKHPHDDMHEKFSTRSSGNLEILAELLQLHAWQDQNQESCRKLYLYSCDCDTKKSYLHYMWNTYAGSGNSYSKSSMEFSMDSFTVFCRAKICIAVQRIAAVFQISQTYFRCLSLVSDIVRVYTNNKQTNTEIKTS